MDCSTPGLPVLHHLLELAQKLVSIESAMQSIHLVLCHPLLLLAFQRVFQKKGFFLNLCSGVEKNTYVLRRNLDSESVLPLIKPIGNAFH